MALKKVQVWLVDETTGEMIEQVNTITAPEAVLFADGSTLTEKLNEIELTPGPKGDTGDTGPQGAKGEKGDVGPVGPKGDQGAPFQIKKLYVSIAAMNADYSDTDVAVGEFVLNDTGSIEDADTAKLYCKGESAYTYITDLSGATGIQGPKGDKGDAGDKIKVGTALASAVQRQIFFKVVS